MSCGRCETSLFLHAHGQLGGIRRWLAERHLGACPTCRAKWARWVVERDALRISLAPPPQAAGDAGRLEEAVAARIRAEGRPAAAAPSPAGWKSRRLAAAMLAAVLMAAGLAALAAFWQPLAGRAGMESHAAPAAALCPTCGQAIPGPQPGPEVIPAGGPNGAASVPALPAPAGGTCSSTGAPGHGACVCPPGAHGAGGEDGKSAR